MVCGYQDCVWGSPSAVVWWEATDLVQYCVVSTLSGRIVLLNLSRGIWVSSGLSLLSIYIGTGSALMLHETTVCTVSQSFNLVDSDRGELKWIPPGNKNYLILIFQGDHNGLSEGVEAYI